jgi:hypothetical protein
MACSETGSSVPQSGTKPWQQPSVTPLRMLPPLLLLLLLAGAVRVTGRLRLSLVLVLLVLASLVWQPTDAFYARLLPALQAAGLPVGSSRSTWPASEFCRSVVNQLVLHYSV